ncbi:hypothetical protein MACH07_14320 [Flagellimonas marinaquae]|uniref:DUF2141 domain-containing protein n=2 Tax=Flavobacteriaceae TaxID=49546 RepID=A0AA48KNX1_9FLAO|nr:hypothetical protein MACH07_14320 [Allomuricauda aquimarina]
MSMKRFLFLFLLPVVGFSQNTLSVQVNNVKSHKGKVNVAVYDSDEGFLSFDQVLKTKSVVADQGSVVLHISDLPSGEYALAVFHDENDNGKLDTNWLGIPKEKVAFSNAKMKTFGPPKYKECAFRMDSDHQIHIDL